MLSHNVSRYHLFIAHFAAFLGALCAKNRDR
jgi:hypothetical protein